MEALRAWRRGAPAAALTALDAAQLHPDEWRAWHSFFYEQPLNRYVRAELLFEQDHYREALRWYASVVDGEYEWGIGLLGPSYRRQAQIFERLGEREKAADYYGRVVALWQDGAPELRSVIEEARRRLAHLQP